MLLLFSVLFSSCKNRAPEALALEKTPEPEWNMVDDAVLRNAEMEKMEEMLLQAALEGDTEIIRAMIEQGVSFNKVDADESTALMYAAYNGHSAIVELLLEKGMEVDRRNTKGQSALLFASTGPFPETVKLLLDHGANPNLTDYLEHFTPLMHAAAEGNLEVLKLLLAAGAKASMKDVDGDDARSFALQGGHTSVVAYLDAQ